MNFENACIFSLITRLCEKSLDESWKRNDRSTSKTLQVKQLRTKAYSTLLIPGKNDFIHGSHDCFVTLISTAFENRVLEDSVIMEDFNECIEHLWKDSSLKSYIPAIVYFLAMMCNARRDPNEDENDNCRSKSSSVLPKKYQIYHPSLFTLSNVNNVPSSDFKLNCLTSFQLLRSNLVRRASNFQLETCGTNFLGEKTNHILQASSPVSRDQEKYLEDASYHSTRSTFLSSIPAKSTPTPWYELNVDYNCNKICRHLTWESLGEIIPVQENPLLSEAGRDAFNSNLKIRDKLLLIMEPRIEFEFREPINWKTLLHHVLCLLMGLESESFLFNKKLDKFELLEYVWLEDISHEALLNCLADLIVMGSCYRRLLAFVESMDVHGQGVVLKAVKESTKHYLNLYQGVCLLVMNDLLHRKSFSVLFMKLKLRGLQEQILCLARAFGMWGHGSPLPNGVEALSHLHQHASSSQIPHVASLFKYILHTGCLVYFSILERWLFNGEVIDERDFFVVAKIEYLSCRNRRCWTRAFQFNTASVPEFLCGLKPFLLRCGKSVNFLKSCDPKHPSLENGLSIVSSLKKNNFCLDRSEELVKKYADMKVCSTKNLVEKENYKDTGKMKVFKVQESEEPIERFSCKEHNHNIKSFHSISFKVDTNEVLGNILEVSPNEPCKGIKQSDHDMMVAKIMSEERKILKKYYEELGEASDRRRLKAKWRSQRMQLRTKVFCSNSDQIKVDCDQNQLNEERLSMKHSFKGKSQSSVLAEDATSAKEIAVEEVTMKYLMEDKIPLSAPKGIMSQKNSMFMLQGAEVVNITRHDKIEVGEEEGAARNYFDPEYMNLIKAEGDSWEEIPMMEIMEEKDTEKIMDQEIVQNMQPSSICLPFLKSLSCSHVKRVNGLFLFKTDSKEEEVKREENNQDIPLEWPYRSILLALMMQSSKMDAALLQWILIEKGLISHLRSLRAYFFLLDGEFGRRLSEDLFSAMRRTPGGKPSLESLNELSLSRILSHALASSTFAASDSNAGSLSLTLSQCPENAQVGDPLACVHMQYKVPWPLNVVLTDEAVSKYSRVLDLLLRLRHASWALEQTFLHLRVMESGKSIDEVSPEHLRSPQVQNSPQYHQLQLYRHQMMHLVRSVQSYITSGVLQASGKKLDDIIAGSSCLDEFYSEHVQYVKKILFGCLLNKHSETIANILNDILRLIMKFHWSLCSRSWHVPPSQENEKMCHYEHPNFNVLRKIHEAFVGMTDFLLKYAWRLASHGYQASLFELLQMINVNNFY